MIKDDLLSEIDFINHAFFTRANGVSRDIYKSLNCGYGSNDSKDNVDANRKIVLANMQNASYLCNLHQTHSNDVLHVVEPWEYPNLPKADAMVTNTPNIAIGVLTADCVPILFCDKKNKIIAATHAGWKGTATNIIQNTISKMIEIGANKSDIVASIGPAIQQDSYEVDRNFKNNFISLVEDAEQFFIPSPNDTRYLFDLTSCTEHILLESGISKISNSKIDTYSNEELFYSYRRSTHKKENDYGRQISVISIK